MLRVHGVIGLLVVCAGGCLGSPYGGGMVVAPAQYDVGAITFADANGVSTGQRLAAGIHTASLDANPRAAFDVALGYRLERADGGDAPSGTPESTLKRGGGVDVERFEFVHGPYTQLMVRVAGNKRHRLWLGSTASLIVEGSLSDLGYTVGVRAAWELIHASKARTQSHTHRGVLGIGLYSEAGTGQMPDGEPMRSMSAGVTVRVPALW